ncbi:C6 zinc finger domain [Lecanosticta acicola]|uniref:C6 zinc finger domain n=1 Tax=Lecanosticta acicola TaxID=111012 RepID=A0AAI8YYT3_9PEZI|nr:C6 zinc finger domain [Lecanosticta acicola]
MGLEDRFSISDARTPVTDNAGTGNNTNTGNVAHLPSASNGDVVNASDADLNVSESLSNSNSIYRGPPDQAVPETPTTSITYQTATYYSSFGAPGQYAESAQDEPTGEEPPRKRRRPALSCEPCRRRKVRCDRMHPCGPCVRMRVQQACEYNNRFPRAGIPPGVDEFAVPGTAEHRARNSAQETPSRGFADFESEVRQHGYPSARSTPSIRETNGNDYPPPESARTVSSSLDELQQTVRELQYRVSRTERLESSTPNAVYDDRTLWEQMRTLQEKVEGLEARISRTETIPPTSPVSTAPKASVTDSSTERDEQQRAGLSLPIPPPRVRKETSKFYGPTHYVHLFNAQTDCLARMLADQGSSKFNVPQDRRTISVIDLFNHVRALRRTIKESRRVNTVDPIRHAIESVRFWNARHNLAGLYFNHCEGLFRILHTPSFTSQYDQHRELIARAPPALLAQFILVCAIGAAFVDDQSELKSLAGKWVYSAQSWLTGPDEKALSDGMSVQSWCLLVLARQLNRVGTKEQTYALAGSMVRAAVSIGLHRDPMHFQEMGPIRTEIRRRVWSTVLELSLSASIDANALPLMCLDDFDTEPPSGYEDELLQEGASIMTSIPASSNQITSTSSQTLLRHSFATRLEVARTLNSFKHDAPRDKTNRLYKELQDAILHAMTHQESKMGSMNLQLLFSVLEIAKLQICCACMSACNTQSSPHFDWYKAEAAMISQELLSKPLKDDQSSIGLSPLGNLALRRSRGLFKSNFSPHVLHIGAQELLQRLRDPTNANTTLGVELSNHWAGMLERKELECLELIKSGDASCKCYVYLHVTNAMTRALEQGRSAEAAVPRALAEALRTCVVEMQKLVDGVPGMTVPELNDVDLSFFKDIDLGADPGWLLGIWDVEASDSSDQRSREKDRYQKEVLDN